MQFAYRSIILHLGRLHLGERLIRKSPVEQLEESTWHRTSFTSVFLVLLHLMSGVITEALQLES